MGRMGGGDGGNGGAGGNGGIGGAGGVGIGGPSVGVIRVGGARAMIDMPTQRAITVGTVGAHGMGVEGMPMPLNLTETARDEDPAMAAPDGGAGADAAVDGSPADASPGDAGTD